MLLDIHTVFQSALLTIRHAVARPSAAPLGPLEHAAADLFLLPISGLFARHDSPGHHLIANPNHALLFCRDQPYRISFPDGLGDESLVFQLSPAALAGLLAETAGVDELQSPRLARHCLLPAAGLLERQRLQQHLLSGGFDALLIEELSLSMLAGTLFSACRQERGGHGATLTRRRQMVETVKQALSLAPLQPWSLDALAQQALTSPFHLARIFRAEVGIPVHRYLVRTRLGIALQMMRAPGADLTAIALASGFANHSHLTASFRALFGITPSQWRARGGN